MADIVLRDRNGKQVEYPGVDRIRLNTTGNEAVEFVDPGLIPESVEKDVTQEELNFANGAITLTPENGQVFSSVNIPVPDNLKADNVAEGVNIAGIIGTLAAGGSVKIATGLFPERYGTITHNLGVIPDIILIFQTVGTTDKAGLSPYMIGFSSFFIEAYPGTPAQITSYNLSSGKGVVTLVRDSDYINNASSSVSGLIYGATETRFTAGSYNNFGFNPSASVRWITIGGLT